MRYGDRESLPLRRDAKLPRFDVIAMSEDGRIFHVEVQIARDRHFLERSLYYTATTYFLQLGQGEEYGDLAPVIFVGLLDFQIFSSLSEGRDKGEDYHTLHRILNVRNHRWEMRGMEFHFLELPKLRCRRAGPRTGLERLQGVELGVLRLGKYLAYSAYSCGPNSNNCVAVRHKRPAQHLRLVAAECWPSA